MDKETLSNYGWIVILVLVLAVMLALATPFGTFIAGAIKSTTAGLFDVNQAALGSAGIDVNDMVFENCDHLETELRNVTDTYTGDTCCKACGTVMSAGQTVRPKVPEGGKYTAADGTVYNPGDEMPETVTTGDKYQYGNYVYGYNQYCLNLPSDWKTVESQNGWGVKCLNNVADPGPILDSINGFPITSLKLTFYKHGNLTIAPVLPDTVTELYYAFKDCTALKSYAGSTDADGDFSNYTIPCGVANMMSTFDTCILMTKAPKISHCTQLTNMDSTFARCTSLIVAPVLPDSVVKLGVAFKDCTSLISAPIIPENVESLRWTFYGCTSLTGTITINTNKVTKIGSNSSGDNYCYNIFNGVDFAEQHLTLTGTSNYLDVYGSTGTNYCATCNGKCQSNH